MAEGSSPSSCRNVCAQIATYVLTLVLAPWVLLYVMLRRWSRGGDGPCLQFGALDTNPPKILLDPKWGKHSYIQLKNIRMHYVENGDSNKPLMLFLHGFPEFWFSWRHQLVEFARDHWVVAVDLRGYGETEKPDASQYKMTMIVEDIRELVEKLGKKKCILVSHDYGGVAAWITAIKHPSIVDKMIVMNCPHPSAFFKVFKSNPRQWIMSLYMFFARLPWLPEYFLSANNLEIFEKIFWVTPHTRQSISKQELDAFKFAFSTPGAFTGPLNYYRAINWLGGLQRGDKPKDGDDSRRREKLRVPTLILWGKLDSFLSLPMAESSQKYVEDITLVTIDEASHWVQQDFPEKVNKYMRDYLASRN